MTIFGQEGSGLICIDAEPICGSSFFNYSNTFDYSSAESGPDYGCLYTPINPAWFYFQIDEPGDLQLKIEQTTVLGTTPDLDVDFIVYGPFNDPRLPCTEELNSETRKFGLEF